MKLRRRFCAVLVPLAALSVTMPAGAGGASRGGDAGVPAPAWRQGIDEASFAFAPFVAPHEAARAGLAMFPAGANAAQKLPVVIFLHGLNERGPLHPWLGGAGRPDQRPVFADVMRERPYVLVAPSQTRRADNPWRLWDGLELGALLSAASQALAGRVVLDESMVTVVAHSGGACNLHGGALALTLAKGPARVQTLIVLDSCFDAPTAARYLEISPATNVEVRYQTDSWDRDIPGFLRGVQGRRNIQVAHAGVRGPGAHDAVLTRSLPEVLRRWVPGPTAP